MTPRLAVVGLGHAGRIHTHKIQTLAAAGEAALAAVCDLDGARAAELGASLGVPAFDDLAALRGLCDAVVIATPSVTHRALAERALRAGFDVLLEKPMAASLDDARALSATAQASDRVLQVGHSERFQPAVQAALALTDPPRYLEAERLSPFSGRGIDDDVIFDLMIHDLDLVATLIPEALAEVRAIGVPILTDHIDMASVRLQFEGGAVAQLSSGRASLEPSRKLRLFTPQRYLSIDTLRSTVKSVRRFPPAPGSRFAEIQGEPIDVPPGDAMLAQLREFVRCVRERGRPTVGAREGCRAVELAEAIRGALQVPRVTP